MPSSLVAYSERLESIDLATRTAKTSKRTLKFDKLISSAPFDKLCEASALALPEGVFSANEVLVYNLGFDKKGAEDVHWVYFPDKSLPFYRIGFYDNIMGTERMSLYVEIGAESGREFDVEEQRALVLAGLKREGYVTDHKLVSWHSVVLNPAYVHITQESMAAHHRLGKTLRASGVYPVGRYGGWTYCSIEDNIIETRALAKELSL